MQYMVRDSNRKEYGPIDLPTLIEWVRQGRVGPDNKVRNLTNGMLLDATHMPELNGMFAVNQARQAAAINSGYLYTKNPTNQVSDHWEDYKFVILMSVLGIFFSMLFAWFGLIFCAIGMKRAYEAARDQKPYSGLGFSIALLSMLAVIAIPFLMGYWVQHIIFPDQPQPSRMRGIDDK